MNKPLALASLSLLLAGPLMASETERDAPTGVVPLQLQVPPARLSLELTESILAEDDVLTPTLPMSEQAKPLAETASTITFAVGTPMHEIERRMLFKTLAFYDNNKVKAAQALGVTTKTIYNRLTAYQSAGKENVHAGGSGE